METQSKKTEFPFKYVTQIGLEPTTYRFLPHYVVIAKIIFSASFDYTHATEFHGYLLLESDNFIVVWNTFLPY